MAMFGGNTKENKVYAGDVSAATNIGQGATLEGNVDTLGNVRIDGKLVGDVKSASKVATGSQSLIEGCVFAKNAEIEGEVHGKLEVAEVLLLKSTANIKGDITAGKLVVEAGAIFNGTCHMGANISSLNTTDESFEADQPI